MARFYTEEDRKNEEARILAQREAFLAKSDWERRLLEEIEETAAEVKEALFAYFAELDCRKLETIKLHGYIGEIHLVMNPDSISAVTKDGDKMVLTDDERNVFCYQMRIKKLQTMPATVQLENGEPVAVTVHGDFDVQFFLQGERIPEEKLAKKLYDYSDELLRLARKKTNDHKILTGPNPEEEYQKRFRAEQARKEAELAAWKEKHAAK